MLMPIATIIGSALAGIGLLLVMIGTFSFRADRDDRDGRGGTRITSPLAITGIISGAVGLGIIIAAYVATFGV